MIERLINSYNEGLNNDLESIIDTIPLNDIVDIYIKYTNPVYIQNKKNISKSLNLICNKILLKLESVSLEELIDLYINVFIEEIFIEDSIDGYKNILKVRNCNLKDEFFIEFESKKQNIGRDEFLNKYIKSLDFYNESLEYHNESFHFLDTLQKGILSFINEKINNCLNDELLVILRNINNKIEFNSNEIIKRNELRKNKKAIDIQRRISETPTIEIFCMLDTTNLKHKNYIYNSLQASIMDKLDNTKNKG